MFFPSSIVEGTLSFVATKIWSTQQSSKIKKWEPEGMTIIFLTAVLRWLPKDTKIHWKKHHFTFHIPGELYSQGSTRWWSNDSRQDLHKLVTGIKAALDLFPPPKIPYNLKGDDGKISEEKNAEEDKEKEIKNNEDGEKEVKNKKDEQKPLSFEELDPLTHIWLSCIDGIIAQQETYGYEPDKNLSLNDKPDTEIFNISHLMNWKSNNEEKFPNDETNRRVAEQLHEAIILIKDALVNGRQPCDIGHPLAERMKKYYDVDKFKGISHKFLELRKQIGNKSPNEYMCKHTIKSIQEECEGLVESFAKERKEIKNLNIRKKED